MEKVIGIPKLPPRRRHAHKGDFGRVLVVGGSRGMIGAPALAANAALRGGAGLVTVAAPEAVQLAVATLCPCATSIPLPCGSDGSLAAAAAGRIIAAAAAADVLAVGPGLGVSAGAESLVRAAIGQGKPVVLDADGLNNLARVGRWAGDRRCGLILTPHPGEMARLTGSAAADVQADREAVAAAATAEWAGQADPPLVLVLKGAGTIVTDGDRLYANSTGNPGMATGGSGDVLTGLIAALLAQGMELFDAACLGVHVHGLAGDMAAAERGEVSLIATDLLEFLPAAFVKLRS